MTAIEIENLSKQYVLGQIGSGTLWRDMNVWWAGLRGKPNPYAKIGQINDRTQKADGDFVWALRDINLKIEEGDVVLVPLLVLMLAGLGLGFGLIITSVTTKYRDLTFLVQFGVQLWMYATPVIYPLSVLAQGRAAKYLWLMKLNPLTSILQTFKLAFLGTGTFSWGYFSYSLCFTVVLMTLGILVFNKVQKSFMDVI